MKNKQLIAVSGGPDSMALLDMTRKETGYIEVAHVNYHKRDSAKRDEKIVRDYCKKYNIKFNKLDIKPEDVKGNFQAYARKARYEYFAKICKKHDLRVVLVAHHKDDNIETYLMQKDKKLGVNHYGLSESNVIYGARVYRPLLNYSKKDLIKYCEDNNIIYGIDESNLSDAYERNKVRHNKVEKLTEEQKDEIVKQIKQDNDLKHKQFHEAVLYIGDRDCFTVDEFKNIPYLNNFLRHFISGNKSDKYINEVIRQLCESDSCYYENNGFYFCKEYQKISMFIRPNDYQYKIKKITDIKYKHFDYFKLAKRGSSTDRVTLTSKDFPITIRNVEDGDLISMKFGTKKLNRFFIDKKIPLKDRLSWPIVLDKKGSAILVPGLGCNIDHYSEKPNLYVIKL